MSRTIQQKESPFFLVYVEPDTPLSELRQHYKEFGYRCPALYDKDHALVKRWNAQKTPETVLLDASGKKIYQGRIDDRYIDFGRSRHQPGQPDFRLALDGAVAGRALTSTTTPVVGCPIPEISPK